MRRNLIVLLALLATGAALAGVWSVIAAPAPPQYDTLALKGEYVDYSELDGSIPGKLVRELGRQAVLLAARDELGLATRDESLGELDATATPLNPEKTFALMPRVRTYWKGNTRLHLEQSRLEAAPGTEPAPTQPEEQAAIEPLQFGGPSLRPQSIYATLANQWEEQAHGPLVETLREAGVRGAAPKPDPTNLPDEAAMLLVEDLSFPAQYAAVRLAHQAVAEYGASAEWLGVLARSYAHLGMLTEHHWSSQPEVFYARALLYAERARRYGDGKETLLLRPYVLAVCGAHANALSELKALGPLGKEAPAWAAVIEPTGRFDHEGLQQLADDRPELRPLALWLAVSHKRTLGYQRAFRDVAYPALEESPAAFGVYNDLVKCYPSLRDQRRGAYGGPAALASELPLRLVGVADLPEGVLASSAPAAGWVGEMLEALPGGRVTPFEKGPNQIAKGLRRAERELTAPCEPSWELLARLIEEEQFVMAANYCQTMYNATEASHTTEAAELHRLVSDHRCARYIAVHQLPKHLHYDPETLAGALVEIDFLEPRYNMEPLIKQMLYLPRTDGWNAGYQASWSAFNSPDLRLPSLCEEIVAGYQTWWEDLKPHRHTQVLDYYEKVSPHSPHWLRQRLWLEKEPSKQQLAEWSEHAKSDVSSSQRMANHLVAAGRADEATEFFERAYELSPSSDSVIALASHVREHVDRDEWLPTLQRFLEEEPEIGLGHTSVESHIAKTLISDDHDYAAALPHAQRAAQSYSADGLYSAMVANEGLARWDEADHWAKALSTSYPSARGYEWWLYRTRTGRGDPAEALPPLEQSFLEHYSYVTRWAEADYLATSGQLPEARDAYDAIGAKYDSPHSKAFCHLVAAILTYELGDAAQLGERIEAAERFATQSLADNPKGRNAMRLCLGLLEMEADGDEVDLNEIQQALDAIPDGGGRLDYVGLVGLILQVTDQESEAAERWLRAAVQGPPVDLSIANLAGHHLAKKHGVSRTEPISARPDAADAPADEHAEDDAPAEADNEAGPSDD
ncbi:hypothetical protein Mal64_25600 [Pseudobythopirellula maris]|uniref:Uncharacterized protein n=1 Tax=Pseudobythopirellula maris TaxID=2527991 RepID=A0A5C5ZPP6_9BACT|nr:hypothetical protein [Pseudobythopirellula maris]TWT89068.1 hypothetical protein Mal64_25600 [Pseudobythopirellula maris]